MLAWVNGVMSTLYLGVALGDKHGSIQLTLLFLMHRLGRVGTLKELSFIEILAACSTAIVDNWFELDLTWLNSLRVVHLEGFILCSVLHVQFWILHFLDAGLLRFLFLILIWSLLGIFGACKLRSDIKVKLTRLNLLVSLWCDVDQCAFQFLWHRCLDCCPIINRSIETGRQRVRGTFRGTTFTTRTNHSLIQIFRPFSIISGLPLALPC